MQVDVPPEAARLLALAEAGDAAGFEALLDAAPGLAPDARNEEGETVLHLACLYGHEPIVRACLQRGADANAIDEDCATPAHNACAGGFLGIVRLLVAARAQLQATDADGDTPLHHACNGNHAHVARFLAEQGASATVTNRSGRTAPALADEPEVRDACAQGAAAYAADPPPGAPNGRRVVKAKRPAGGGGGGADPSEFMPPPPPRPPPGPTLSAIGRRPSRRDMAPVPAEGGADAPGADARAAGADPLGGFELPPELLQRVLQDPDFAGALGNPRLLGAMREVLAEPARFASVCAQSPELTGFLQRILALSEGS